MHNVLYNNKLRSEERLSFRMHRYFPGYFSMCAVCHSAGIFLERSGKVLFELLYSVNRKLSYLPIHIGFISSPCFITKLLKFALIDLQQ